MILKPLCKWGDQDEGFYAAISNAKREYGYGFAKKPTEESAPKLLLLVESDPGKCLWVEMLSNKALVDKGLLTGRPQTGLR